MFQIRLRQTVCLIMGVSLIALTGCRSVIEVLDPGPAISILPVPTAKKTILKTEMEYGYPAQAPEFVIWVKRLKRAEIRKLHSYVKARDHVSIHERAREWLPRHFHFQEYLKFEIENNYFDHHTCNHETHKNAEEFRAWFGSLFLKERFYDGDQDAWNAQQARIQTLTNTLATKLYVHSNDMTIYNLHENNEDAPFSTYVGLNGEEGLLVIVEHVL